VSEKTTPTPWSCWSCCEDDYKSLIEAGIYGSEGIRIATMVAPVRSIDKGANARLICRCVNSHQALVDALTKLTEGSEEDCGDHCTDRCIYCQARAALKLAEGGRDVD
jgi:hypothetical protein